MDLKAQPVLPRSTIFAFSAVTVAGVMISAPLYADSPPDEPNRAENPCVNAFKTIFAASKPERKKPLADSLSTALPPDVLQFHEEISATVHVNWAIPATEQEFKNVYSAKRVKMRTLKKVATDGWAYTKRFGKDGKLSSRSDFANTLKESAAKIQIIIGHNEGGAFRFLDGTTSDLNSMAEQCTKEGKFCVFLSCDSADLVSRRGVGVDRRLMAREARWIAERLEDYLAASRTVEPREIAAFVDLESKRTLRNYRVVYVAEAAASGAPYGFAVALVVCAIDDEHCGLLKKSETTQSK